MGLFDFFKKRKAEPHKIENSTDISIVDENITDNTEISIEAMETNETTLHINTDKINDVYELESDDLTYDETVMLKYLDGMIYGKVIKNYMFERFGDRINEIGDEFLLSGHFELTTAEENLQKATAAELKEALKSQELKISGSKSELIKRIIDNISHEEIEKLFPNSRYKLSQLGEKAIADKEAFFTNENLAIGFTNCEITAAIKENPNMNSLSVLEKMLKDRGQFYYKTNKISLLRVTFNNIYRIKYEKQDYLDALFNAFASEYIEMSGLFDDNIVSPLFMRREHEVNADCIHKCLSALNYSTDKFKEIAINQFIPILPNLAFSFYTPETLIDMICDRLNGIYKSSKEYPYNEPETNNPNYSYSKLY